MSQRIDSFLGRLAVPVVRRVPEAAVMSHVGLTLVLLFRVILALSLVSLAVFLRVGRAQAMVNLSVPVTVAYCAYVGTLVWLWLYRRRDFASPLGRRAQLALDLGFGMLLVAASESPGSSSYYFVFAIPVALSAWYSQSGVGLVVLVVLGASIVADLIAFRGTLSRSDHLYHLLLRFGVLASAWLLVRIARRHLREQAMAEAQALVLRDGNPAYMIRPDFSLAAINEQAAGEAAGGQAAEGQRCFERIGMRSEPCEGCPVPTLLSNEEVQGSGTVVLGAPGRATAGARVTAFRVLGHERSGAPQAVRLTHQPAADPTPPGVTSDPAQLLALASTLGAEIETLVDIAVSVLGREDRDLPDALRQIRAQLANVVNVDGWYVALYSRQARSLVFPLFHVGGDEREWRERPWSEEGYTESVLATGRPRRVGDTRAGPEPGGAAESGGVPDEYPCRCWAGVPLAYRGQVFGVMAVRSPLPDFYSTEDLERLRRTAAAVSYAVLGVIRRQQLLQPPTHGDPFELPPPVAPPASDMLSAVLAPVLGTVRAVIPFDTATLQLVDDGQLVVVAAEGWQDAEDILHATFGLDEDTPNAAVYKSGRITTLPDAQQRYASLRGHGRFAGRRRSWLGVPLKHRRTGEVIAVMAFDKYDEPEFYGEMHRSVATVISPFLADPIARAAAHRTRWVRTHRLTVVDLIPRIMADRPEAVAADDVMDVVTISARLLADAFDCRAGVAVSSGERPMTVVAERVGNAVVTQTTADGEVAPVEPPDGPPVQAPVTYLGRPLGTVFLVGPGDRLAGDEEDVSVLESVAGLIAPYLDRAAAARRGRLGEPGADLADVLRRATLVEDGDGIVRDCNAAFQQLIGGSWQEIVDRHFLSFVPESLRPALAAEWRRRTAGRPGQYETVLLRQDGGEVPVRVSARPVMREHALSEVVVSFTGLNGGLYHALDQAGRQVQDAAADKPLKVMQAIGAALEVCGLRCVVLHREAAADTMRIDYVSLTATELKRLRSRTGIQLRGTGFELGGSPSWRGLVAEGSAAWWPDPRPLLNEVAGGPEARQGLARYLRFVGVPPAVVVPTLAYSGVLWMLVAWGASLRREDVAPLASFWRGAADKLTEADERTRNRRRAAPKTQLYRRRERVGELLGPFLSLARAALGADRATLYGLRPTTSATYPIVASPAYPSAGAVVSRPGSGAMRLCASTGVQQVVGDVGAVDSAYLASPEAADADQRAVAALPLYDNGSRLAILELQSRVVGAFHSAEQAERLDRLREEAERLLQAAIRPVPATGQPSIGSLRDFHLGSAADTLEGGAYRRYVGLVAELLAAEECSIWLRDQESPDRLRRVASLKQPPATDQERGARIGTEDGVGFTGYVAATGEAVCEWGDHIRENPKWQGSETQQFDLYATGRCDSVLAVPIPRANGALPALGVLKVENKLSGPDDPPRFGPADRDQLERIARMLAHDLPAWMEREQRLKANMRDIGGVHRDRIHAIRSAISVTTSWGLQDLVDNWQTLDEAAKQREVERAIVNLHAAATDLLQVEELVLRRISGSPAPADLPKLIRLKVEQFSLDRCTDVEVPEDLLIDDDEVAVAVYDFIAEQLTNVCKYARIDRDVPGQVLVRVSAGIDEVEVLVRDRGVGVTHALGDGAFRTLKASVEPLGGHFEPPRTTDQGGGLEVRATLPLSRSDTPEGERVSPVSEEWR